MKLGLKKNQKVLFEGWTEVKVVGETGRAGGYPIIVHANVNEAVEKYCHLELKKEVGGVLVGREGKSNHVEILGAIEAKYAEHQAASLTFTHRSWDYIHETLESKYPKLKIVGWFHTHPGYGIFLSNYDIFIHKNFFSLPYQVALVIDPCQEQRGFFAWKKDKVEKLSHYYTGISDEKVAEVTLQPLEFQP